MLAGPVCAVGHVQGTDLLEELPPGLSLLLVIVGEGEIHL